MVQGITALETAIILIAFIVAATVFAFTILSSGTFSVGKAKEAVHAGLSEVRGSMEQKGNMMATGTVTNGVQSLIFVVANTAGGQPIELAEGANRKVVIDYRDETQREVDRSWTKTWRGYDDGDDLLEEGEQAEITLDLSGLTNPLMTNTAFAIEIRPPQGGVLVLERTTPARIDVVMDLH